MNDLPGLLAHLLPGDPVGVILPDGAAGSVTADRLVLVRRENGAVTRLVDGSEFQAALDFISVSRRLLALPNWIKVSSDGLVNLDHLKRVYRSSDGRRVLLLSGGGSISLTSAFAGAFRARLGVESIDRVYPISRAADWMLKENLREFETPINLMKREELIAAFGSSGPADVIASDVIKNFLWQFVSRIRAGIQPPLEGQNVRSLWYVIKPALWRVNAKGDHYKTLSDKLALFVARDMMSYREFGLVEEENWSIGDRRPEVIVAAEKRSHFRFLQTIQKEHGVSIIALAGKPKQITSEYFTDAFKEKVPKYWEKDRVLVVGMIDYDPSGWIIGRTFLEDLRVFGIKHSRLVDLVKPSHFNAEELEAYKYSLIKPDAGSGDGEGLDAGDATTLKKWMKKFGGVNGEPYGLETDALMITPDKVKALIRQTLGRRSK